MIPNKIHHPASFRDPSGFIFNDNQDLLRQVNLIYKDNFDLLISSGLYRTLTQKNWLISHTEIKDPFFDTDSGYKILRPEKIEFISYPYEWSFSQLKDAALLTLEIQKEALAAGMSLKDSSVYNIQFRYGSPILIDTLSFEKYEEGSPWVAYRQFCQHFLAPLVLMSKVDIRLNQLLKVYIDGIPLDLASRLLPWTSRLDFGLLTHIHLHAAAQTRYSDKEVHLSAHSAPVSKLSLMGLIANLENTVKKLKWKPGGTEWGQYYQITNYSDTAFETKKQVVKTLISQIKPEKIWDLGANNGLFSRVAAESTGRMVVSSDIDPSAVEINYLECKANKNKLILPLVIDLTNPSASIGWNNTERISLIQRGPVDLVMALALIHHLVISNNVPLEDAAQFFAGIGKHLIIEFVPKEDSQVQRLLASRQDIFTKYNAEGFLKAFLLFFNLRQQIPIEGTSRIMFWFEKRA